MESQSAGVFEEWLAKIRDWTGLSTGFDLLFWHALIEFVIVL